MVSADGDYSASGVAEDEGGNSGPETSTVAVSGTGNKVTAQWDGVPPGAATDG